MTVATLAARTYLHWQREWQHFRLLPVGLRFQIHNREQRKVIRKKPSWQRVLQLTLIPLLVAVGSLMVFTPGPGFVAYALAAALLASYSRWFARALDRAEVFVRSTWRKFR